jgi:hypothetical protein
MSLPMSSGKSELLAYIQPFCVGTRHQPGIQEMKRVEALVDALQKENPTPDLRIGFSRVQGTWRCVFTTSRYVLGLDRLHLVRLSAVYQSVFVYPDGITGHYFNIAELSRGARVRAACGEYANVQLSDAVPGRLEVQYQWFYFAIRAWSRYEGHRTLSDHLETGAVRTCVRLPFHKVGWQSILYLDDDLRIVRGSEGGLFVLVM